MKKQIKHLLIFTIIGLVTLGCETPQKDLKLSENVKTYQEAWSQFFDERNMEIINDQYFTEDVTVVIPGDNIIGIEGTKNYYGNFLTGFSDAEFTFVDIFGQGDKLVKHWNFKGTHDGDFFGIPPTGKSLNLYGTTLILMEDGKIKQEQDFFDNLDMLTQLGVIE
jgi:steroid delta-isomerase-like uncharacterized protein|tara:strand:- start:878 stop:1372 length:495 start_codon:yes stop_codon:yes gene_type:complete